MFIRKGCPRGFEVVDEGCYPELKNRSIVNYSKIEKRDDIRLASKEDVKRIRELFGHNPHLEKFDSFFVKDKKNGYSEIYGHYLNMVFEFEVPDTT